MQTGTSRAFTTTEILITITLVVILAALLTPVFGRTKQNAKILQSMSNLHQMHVGAILYQNDWGGGGVYGDLPEMGLPNLDYVFLNRFGLPLDLWKSPCGTHPSETQRVINYFYRPDYGGPKWAQEALLYQENVRLFYDVNCTDHSQSLLNPFTTKTGLAVLLSGQVVKRNKVGDMERPEWWSFASN
jgi:hypothetical protein